jgi:protein O-GlcNAc transferase
MSEENSNPNKPSEDKNLTFTYSPNFLEWFKNNNCGIVATSYKTNMVYSLGVVHDNTDNIDKLSLWFNWHNRPTAICADGDHIWLSTMHQILKCSNSNSKDDLDEGFDACYVPMVSHNTQHIDGHDFMTKKDGTLLFVNTKFSCISSLSDKYNFNVEYVPPWISRVAPEDRCHLNGMCLDENDNIKYISSVCDSDVQDGWRNRRKGEEGFIYDVQEDKKACENLTMPHSPRIYNGKLWLLNSGKGEFGYVEDGKFVPLVFIPGFLRGLDFVGKYAIIGSSLDRHEGRFSDLMLGDILKEKKIEARCGIYVVDTTNGFIINQIEFDNVIEMYDVKIIKNVQRPRIISFDSEISNSTYRLKKR